MELTHLGHACLRLDVAGQRILIDPGNFSDVAGQSGLTAILVTHQHKDHRDPDTWDQLLADNPDAQLWAEPQTAGQLSERVRSMTSGEDITLGAVRVTPVGDQHAKIHNYIPKVGNLGVVIRAKGEPVVFHPGDALDAEPGEVDILCVPVNAPWGKVGEMVEFVRRIAPRRVVPIHDGLLNATGRGMYLTHIGNFGAEGGVEVLDLAGVGPTTV